MYLNLIMAAGWIILGLGLLLAPTINDSYLAGMDRDTRLWAGGFALVLACYNVIRCRLTRARRQLDEEARLHRPIVRPHRHEEPPNPDFDFSDREKP